MDRKEFLKACVGSVCGCVAVYGMAAAAEPVPEDPKAAFVKQRHAKLLQSLQGRVSEADLAASMQDVGAFCSAASSAFFAKYRGDIDGFIQALKVTNTPGKTVAIDYDRDHQVITMITDYGGDCFCPLNGKAAQTPGVACNCSIGWHAATWKMITQKNVRVEMKESPLRGGKRCIFAIHLAEA